MFVKYRKIIENKMTYLKSKNRKTKKKSFIGLAVGNDSVVVKK